MLLSVRERSQEKALSPDEGITELVEMGTDDRKKWRFNFS